MKSGDCVVKHPGVHTTGLGLVVRKIFKEHYNGSYYFYNFLKNATPRVLYVISVKHGYAMVENA